MEIATGQRAAEHAGARMETQVSRGSEHKHRCFECLFVFQGKVNVEKVRTKQAMCLSTIEPKFPQEEKT